MSRATKNVDYIKPSDTTTTQSLQEIHDKCQEIGAAASSVCSITSQDSQVLHKTKTLIDVTHLINTPADMAC